MLTGLGELVGMETVETKGWTLMAGLMLLLEATWGLQVLLTMLRLKAPTRQG
jgi:hypothetical protein